MEVANRDQANSNAWLIAMMLTAGAVSAQNRKKSIMWSSICALLGILGISGVAWAMYAQGRRASKKQNQVYPFPKHAHSQSRPKAGLDCTQTPKETKHPIPNTVARALPYAKRSHLSSQPRIPLERHSIQQAKKSSSAKELGAAQNASLPRQEPKHEEKWQNKQKSSYAIGEYPSEARCDGSIKPGFAPPVPIRSEGLPNRNMLPVANQLSAPDSAFSEKSDVPGKSSQSPAKAPLKTGPDAATQITNEPPTKDLCEASASSTDTKASTLSQKHPQPPMKQNPPPQYVNPPPKQPNHFPR
ncbi:uncharacterized protein NEMAJ01_1177 [Nematocida major]|uniref:uncharacterized protein n=1 Tax=Nematocida major TaxID=1912982 RepID=UPI002007C87A|nr:uncharacterized protein NEMAJ01_1177 [Nematocida major]KAH9386281.1 hypothetical protein NEMAJ01_1177 [Nematocida major]